jgi:hypothetical protein
MFDFDFLWEPLELPVAAVLVAIYVGLASLVGGAVVLAHSLQVARQHKLALNRSYGENSSLRRRLVNLKQMVAEEVQ